VEYLKDNERVRRTNALLDAMMRRYSLLRPGRMKSSSKGWRGTILPPCSLHTFLKANLSVTHVLVTNYQKQFSDRFYNTFLDTLQPGDNTSYIVDNLVTLGDAVTNLIIDRLLETGARRFTPAHAHFQLHGSGETNFTHVDVRRSVVQTLFDCFSAFPFWNCSLLQRAMQSWVDLGVLTPDDFATPHANTYMGARISTGSCRFEPTLW